MWRIYLFDEYTKTTGSLTLPPNPNFNTITKILPDGTRIALRNESKTGGRTIDVKVPGKKSYKIHIGP